MENLNPCPGVEAQQIFLALGVAKGKIAQLTDLFEWEEMEIT